MPPTPRYSREYFGLRAGFGLWAGLVVLFAFLVREYFVLAMVVDVPIRGDVREYLLYAWNLYHHGTFSLSEPGTIAPVADAYRSPGYPWMLLLCMWLRPHAHAWYQLALQLQVLLGTATVGLTMLLGRRWLGIGWSLGAGVLLALWPHHIAATGVLLSEVLFGFTLMASLYALAIGMERRSPGLLALAGALYGWAYLVNPVIAVFPPIAALLIWRRVGNARMPSLYLAVFLVPLLAFAARNAQLAAGAPSAGHVGRAAMNLVQGAWPEYHQAWHAQLQDDPGGRAILQQINNDAVLLDAHPVAGIASLADRMRHYPAHFSAWYLWEKPALLWSWDIQIGHGGVYVLDVRHSPLETHPLLRASTATLRALNPLATLLAFAGTMLVLAGALKRMTWVPATSVATALMFAYLTTMHTIFQAEPRYAIAYRGIEVLLLMSCLQALWLALMHMRFPPKVTQYVSYAKRVTLYVTHLLTTQSND